MYLQLAIIVLALVVGFAAGTLASGPPAVTMSGPGVLTPAPAPAAGEAQLQALRLRLDAAEAHGARLEAELARLRTQVEALADGMQGGDAVAAAPSARAPASPEATRQEDGSGEAPAASLAELSVADMVAVGIPVDEAQRVQAIADATALARLELEDRASREGWLGSARYAGELAQIDEGLDRARDELGEDAYERLLYASGRSNRVAVRSVITGSAAEAAGILPGDRLLRYAGERIYDGEALRAATRAGDPGSVVAVEVLRDGSPLVLYLPRGPIGIRMGFVRELP